MDVDDYTQSVEAVMAKERRHAFPLGSDATRELFDAWRRVNPEALREMELTAMAIDARGMRVSAKYLIEKQRYEGRAKLRAVPFTDQYGMERTFGICNAITPLIGRWLLSRHPGMRVVTCKSMFDKEDKK